MKICECEKPEVPEVVQGDPIVKCQKCGGSIVAQSNIGIVKIVQPELGFDMLEDIFLRNKRFTDFTRSHPPREGMPEKILSDLAQAAKTVDTKELGKALTEIGMLRNSIALFSEVMEYTNELSWKWWGRGKWQLDRVKALEELVDLQHFIFVATDDLGYTARDFYEAYVKKNNHNWKRFREKIGWKKSPKEHDDHPEEEDDNPKP